MQSEEQKEQVKLITMQALNRLEELKLEPSASGKPKSKPADSSLLSQLDRLPPPPSKAPKGASQSSTLPKPTGKMEVCRIE